MGGYGSYLGYRIRYSDDVVWKWYQLLHICCNWKNNPGPFHSHLDHDMLWSFQEEKAKAKDLHPKLLAGMFFFFAAGATGGVTALLTSDKPIFERYRPSEIMLLHSISLLFSLGSPCSILFTDVLRLEVICIYFCSSHAVTGFIGLGLLTIQTILPSLFEVIILENIACHLNPLWDAT